MTKTKDHRKADMLNELLTNALFDSREEAQRHFAAKARTAGAHAVERDRRQKAEAEVARLRLLLADVYRLVGRGRSRVLGQTNLDRTFNPVGEMRELLDGLDAIVTAAVPDA